MVTAKDCHTLISYYLRSYEDLYGRKPTINRNTARWSVQNMLEDMSMVEFKELVDFYMTTRGIHGHSLSWFFNNYDKLIESKSERDADVENRKKLMEETRRRTEEWRQRANSRRETD